MLEITWFYKSREFPSPQKKKRGKDLTDMLN